MKVKQHYLDTEEACAMPDPEYDKCVNSESETPDIEQYRKDTEKMHWLQQEWDEVYATIKRAKQ